MGGNNKGILESWAYKANYSRMKEKKKKEWRKEGIERGTEKKKFCFICASYIGIPSKST